MAMTTRSLDSAKINAGDVHQVIKRAHHIYEAIIDHIDRRYKDHQGSLVKPTERAKMSQEL